MKVNRRTLPATQCLSTELTVNNVSPAAVAPPLPSRPIITSQLVGQSVHLKCAFVPPPWRQPLAFQVVWARHIGHSMKAEIRQETTSRSFTLSEMDGVHFRLGETVIPVIPWGQRPRRRRGQGWFDPSSPGGSGLTSSRPVASGKGGESQSSPAELSQGQNRDGEINQLQTGAKPRSTCFTFRRPYSDFNGELWEI